MKTISTQARILAAISALLMSSAVLGGTVTAMQSAPKAEMPTILMERVVITRQATSYAAAPARAAPGPAAPPGAVDKTKPGFGRVLFVLSFNLVPGEQCGSRR